MIAQEVFPSQKQHLHPSRCSSRRPHRCPWCLSFSDTWPAIYQNICLLQNTPRSKLFLTSVHFPPHFTLRKRPFRSCLESSIRPFSLTSYSSLAILAVPQEHWAPPTLGGWPWVFPPLSGLCSNVTCSMRPPSLSSPYVLRELNQTMPSKCTDRGMAPDNAHSVTLTLKPHRKNAWQAYACTGLRP